MMVSLGHWKNDPVRLTPSPSRALNYGLSLYHSTILLKDLSDSDKINFAGDNISQRRLWKTLDLPKLLNIIHCLLGVPILPNRLYMSHIKCISKPNVNWTRIRRPKRHLNLLCTINFPLVSRGMERMSQIYTSLNR